MGIHHKSQGKYRKERLIKEFLQIFASVVKSALSGFDRIVFKGCILPLMSAAEAMKFCGAKGVFNKDYKNWVMAQAKKIVDDANDYSENILPLLLSI